MNIRMVCSTELLKIEENPHHHDLNIPEPWAQHEAV